MNAINPCYKIANSWSSLHVQICLAVIKCEKPELKFRIYAENLQLAVRQQA